MQKLGTNSIYFIATAGEVANQYAESLGINFGLALELLQVLDLQIELFVYVAAHIATRENRHDF